MGAFHINGQKVAGVNIEIKPEIYSEEEREVGVWTDGRPVYQKSYDNLSFTLPSQINWIDTGIPVTDIDVDTYITGFIIDEYKQSFPTALATLSSTNTIGIIVAGNQSNRTITGLTLQYTKTTDQPGSGQWTPDGAYAHHYSTDEHIVGTFIDGSTIYEITTDLGSSGISVPSGGTAATDIPVGNIDKIIYTQAISQSGKYFPVIGAEQGSTYINMLNMSGSNRNVRWFTIQYTKSS